MQTPIDLISEEQYLVQEPQAEYKSEFRDGRVVAMSGASPAHSLITVNLIRELSQQLKTRPCHTFSSDTRVKVPKAHFYTYPDVSVVCAKPIFDPRDQCALLNPTVIVEILSPGTEAYDRGQKFGYYKQLDSLREYVLVRQDRVGVEVFARQENGAWLDAKLDSPDGVLELASISCRVELTEIYHKVTFEP